jgi:SpoVK/Ycf46/Vps4 family AAA+-type ATPase
LEDLDDAVIRRFESKIYLGVPAQLERVELVQHFIKGISHSIEENEVCEFADTLFSWSGSEIETLCREASMAPLRQIFSFSQSACLIDIDKHVSNIRPLVISDFLEAHDRLTSPLND